MTNNTYYKKMFKVATATAVAAGAVVAVAPSADAAISSFPDVTDKNVHAENIEILAGRGIVQGFPNGTYQPYGNVTRGQAAKIIAGVLGLETDPAKVKNPGFTDLQTTNEFYGPVAALVELGAINGFPDNTYKTYQPITRVQIAKIIAEAFDLASTGVVNPFTDAKNSTIGSNVAYVDALFATGVTTGTTPSTFSPRANVTRGQIASFVVRAEEAAKATVETITTKVTSVTAGKVATAAGTYSISAALADFFTKNAAALVNADVEVVVETKGGVSTVIGIKKLTVNAAGAKLDLAGVKLEELTVAAAGVEIANGNADAVVFKPGATARFSGTANFGTVVVPPGTNISDIIENYDELPSDAIGEVEEDTNTTPNPPVVTPPVITYSEAQLADNAMDQVALAVKDVLAAELATFGTAAYANDKLTLTFDAAVKGETLSTVKDDLLAKQGTIETLVKDYVFDTTNGLTETQFNHLKNVKEVKVASTTDTAKVKTYGPFSFTAQHTRSDVLILLRDTFSVGQLKQDLADLSGFNAADAATTTVEDYLTTAAYGKTFKVTLTFSDNSTLTFDLEVK